MALIMGSLLCAFPFIVPYMTFLTEGYQTQTIGILIANGFTELEAFAIVNDGVIAYLNNLKMTIWPLAGFMPMWIWYITRSRCISAGGKTNITALVDAIDGCVQICWISILVFIIIPNTGLSFPLAYTIFFLSDSIKLIVYEVLFYNLNWGKNLTLETKDPETISQESQKINT